MTKQEFDTTETPLSMVISLNPDTGKVLWDTYDPRVACLFVEDFKKDFPDMIHTQIVNKAEINRRKKEHGL